MAVAQLTEVRTSPQQLLQIWINEDVLEAGPVELDREAIIRRARRRFANDKEFLDTLVEYALPGLVSDALHRACTKRRYVSVGRDYMTAETLEKTIMARAARWYEHVGGSIRKPLLSLTRDELLFSAGRRAQQASTQLRWASFERDLAQDMNESQTVADRYPAADLAAKYAEHFNVDKEERK